MEMQDNEAAGSRDNLIRAARSKFRILHLTTVHNCDDTRIFHKEVRSLRAGGYVTKLVGRKPKQSPSDLDPVSFLAESSSRLSRIASNFSNVKRIVEEIRPDLLHFHDPEILATLPLIRKFCGKIVYDSHEHLSKQVHHKAYIPAPFRLPLSMLLGSVERLLIKYADAVVAPTPDILDYFQNRGMKTVMVGNFPEFNLFAQPAPGQRKNQTCQTGGLSRSRSAFELVEAARTGGYPLMLAGNADSEVQQLLTRPDLPENIRYLGYVSRGQALALQNESKVGFSLLTATPQYETAIPTKAFEYIASHMAPVLDDMPFTRTLFAPFKCVRHCNAGDPADIAEKAKAALHDYDDMADELAADFEYARAHFSWESQENNLLGLYDSLLLR